MNILLQTKAQVEQHFGKQGTFESNLLGMVDEGEKAWGFRTGDLSQGFEIRVGFFNDKARYVAFKKRTGSPWNEGDLRATLSQIGRYADWSVKADSDFFDYTEKKGDQIVAEATGWKTPNRKYDFAYVADVAGEVGLAPDKTAVDQKFQI